MTDSLDKAILAQLTQDARISVAVLARKLDVARSTIQARIARLEENGTIAGYTLRVGNAAREARITTTVLLTIEPHAHPTVLAGLRTIPEVEYVSTTSGRFDLLLKIVAPTPPALNDVLDLIGEISGVKSSESLIHLATKLDRTT
ncbi:Lrp/AsnC family transcriptional regulator [Falsihalocynthiibacter sp. SS001]|uniref:Lrp/AsnC family transcriptional regulator n=1 Tax=Falsihalocynthiibacter sp. SS001 TaxID=3349698 RepID=UPI0036D3AD36